MLTAPQLKAICIYSKAAVLESFVTPLNRAMDEFEINTPLRMAAFIAQVAHESGSFNYLQELASGHAYDDRKDLGNLEPEAIATAKLARTTAGRFYRGHGVIQITGYYNHKKCGEALGLDLVKFPKLLTEPVNACRSAAWFWVVGAGLNLSKTAIAAGVTKGCNLNTYADRKEFKLLTVAINGGYNGLEDRSKYYIRALRVI